MTITHVLMTYWYIIPIALLLGITQSNWGKGILGELIVRITARFSLEQNTYHAIHNVMLPTPDGTTQIDHIYVSKYGVFVLETKHMQGWIFGKENDKTWTQKIYKKTHHFQNPLRQNYKHTQALAALSLPENTIHSIIVFTGNSTFKTPMPENITTTSTFIPYIKSHTQTVLTETQVQDVINKIKTNKLKTTLKTQHEHITRLKSRNNPNSQQRCPKCGNPMVVRSSKNGDFWGCSQFPKCRTTRSIS